MRIQFVSLQNYNYTLWSCTGDGGVLLANDNHGSDRIARFTDVLDEDAMDSGADIDNNMRLMNHLPLPPVRLAAFITVTVRESSPGAASESEASSPLVGVAEAFLGSVAIAIISTVF